MLNLVIYCPVDQVILNVFGKLCEVRTIARHPYKKVFILIGRLLRLFQQFGADYVKLHVIAAQQAVGTQEVREFRYISVLLQYIGRETHIEKRSIARSDMIQL